MQKNGLALAAFLFVVISHSAPPGTDAEKLSALNSRIESLNSRVEAMWPALSTREPRTLETLYTGIEAAAAQLGNSQDYSAEISAVFTARYINDGRDLNGQWSFRDRTRNAADFAFLQKHLQLDRPVRGDLSSGRWMPEKAQPTTRIREAPVRDVLLANSLAYLKVIGSDEGPLVIGEYLQALPPTSPGDNATVKSRLQLMSNLSEGLNSAGAVTAAPTLVNEFLSALRDTNLSYTWDAPSAGVSRPPDAADAEPMLDGRPIGQSIQNAADILLLHGDIAPIAALIEDPKTTPLFSDYLRAQLYLAEARLHPESDGRVRRSRQGALIEQALSAAADAHRKNRPAMGGAGSRFLNKCLQSIGLLPK